mmetsp:Transcript_24818/g.53509  ORF Transcript_24818/g.53509 Transcript_24818/m.53509 type:complete len:296 (-) Transcript_24818:33-920(-)
MVKLHIKACGLALFLFGQVISATSHQEKRNGHKICKQLNGSRQDIQVTDFLQDGVALDTCVLSFPGQFKGETRQVYVDPRIWETKTIAGSILSHGPIIDHSFFKSGATPFIGTIRACAALGGVSAGTLDLNMVYRASNEAELGVCVFSDSSFADLWSLIYLSQANIVNSKNMMFRPILEAGVPVFEQLQPKTTINDTLSSNIYQPESYLTPCTKNRDCEGKTACDNQPTTRCQRHGKAKTGVCVSSTRDIKCSTGSDCTRNSYLGLNYLGTKGFCFENFKDGSIACKQSRCTPVV